MGLLDFFKRKDDPEQGSPILTDMHSHYLHGIDDGSETIENTMEMLKLFAENGYKKAYASPHIMGDFYQNTPEIINGKLGEVQQRAAAEGIQIELKAAAEYYLDEVFIKRIEKDEKLLTMGDNYVLFETSYINEPSQLNEVIFGLKSNGYKPIFAHPERYTYMYNEFRRYEELYEKGIYFQVNLLSLIGHYSPMAKRIAEKLIDARMISFAGTDAHSIRHLHSLEQVQKTKYYKKLLTLPLLNNTL